MEVPMTNKSDDSENSDVELLASWREWLSALDAEMSATNERDALANFLDGFDDGGEPAVSAYLDTVRMLDRDFLAEAEAVVDRSKQGGSRNVRKALHAERSRQVDRST
jgi:hypothetical protein